MRLRAPDELRQVAPKSGEVLWQGVTKGAGSYGHGHAEPAKRYTRRTYSGGGCTPSSRRTHGLGFTAAAAHAAGDELRPSTGAELPLVAKAGLTAAEAGARALEEQSKTTEVLLELAKDDPAMKMSARSFAHRVAIRQRALERLYAPLRWFAGFQRDYFDQQITQDMAEHTASIPEERLVTPPAQIAIPTMEGLA